VRLPVIGILPLQFPIQSRAVDPTACCSAVTIRRDKRREQQVSLPRRHSN
jgi:hypothetical protein